MWFTKKKEIKKNYDPTLKQPAIRISICTGEQVAGFIDLKSEKFLENTLIRTPKDLENFKKIYGIEGEIKKIY